MSPLHSLSLSLSLSILTKHLTRTTTPSSSSSFLLHRHRSLPSNTMSAAAPFPLPASHAISLPSQPGVPVRLVAGPEVSEPELKSAVECRLFKQWLRNLEGEKGVLGRGSGGGGGGLELREVLIQGVDYFGKRVGFLKFKADMIDKETGHKVPGIVFARGPAVAILILLESEGETYAVLTEQVRVPIGRFVLELPAGMLDDDKGDFVGTAVREVEEETGIRLNVGDMIELTAFLDSSTGSRVFLSPVTKTGLGDTDSKVIQNAEQTQREGVTRRSASSYTKAVSVKRPSSSCKERKLVFESMVS